MKLLHRVAETHFNPLKLLANDDDPLTTCTLRTVMYTSLYYTLTQETNLELR